MTRSNSKKSNPVLSALLLICFLPVFIFAQGSTRNTKKELETRKKRITQEITEINSMLSETKASKKTSIGALVNINIKLSKRQDLIRTINAEIGELNKDIEESEKEIERQKAALQKLKQEYARLIMLAQKNQDAHNTLMFILAADNFNQAYARMKYMQQYAEFRRKQAKEITETEKKVTAGMLELIERRRQKNELLGIEEKEKTNLAIEKTQKEEVLATLQKKEQQLKSELEKRKRDAIQLQLAIKKLIEAEIKKKAEEAARAEQARILAKKAADAAKALKKLKKKEKATSTPPAPATPEKEEKPETPEPPTATEESIALSEVFSNNRGKLPWPVSRGVICESYGEYEHPAIKGFMMFNNGVEICATKGMQARAVFSGEVTGIANSPTGGKLVIIRHGEYFSVYDHLGDVLVKTGQKVTPRQGIGTVLYDEDQGKTSMNLQIWKGQKTMDPTGWLSRTP